MLAHGGMGTVYLAAGSAGQEVALKLLRPDFASDELVRRRFDREARMAQRIDHPHVVPVLDVGEHEGTPYLAQAFVRGGSLQDRLDADGPLSVADTVRMAVEVGGALDAIHAVGLVHRDIKPANILLDERGVGLHHRLRPGQGLAGQQPDQARPGGRLAGLHGAGADPRRGGRPADRRVRARVRALHAR